MFSCVQVPCYSYGQKLSKLAILRIACNYILSLAQLAEQDDGADCSSHSFTQCVEQCTRTLQAEGRSKKRKVIIKASVCPSQENALHINLCVFSPLSGVNLKWTPNEPNLALIKFKFFDSCSMLLTLFKGIASLYNS